MALSVIVCVKPVPASDSVTIDPTTKTVRRSAGENVLSSLDRNALEAAAQLKKALDCTVTVLTMAPASAEINIREALARGGDRGLILSDRAFAGGDTFATSYVLASAIKQLGGCDLILTGAASDDGGTGQLGAQLAEWLGYDHLHNATELSVEGNALRVSTLMDKRICTWECPMPALITIDRTMNKPGPASARNVIMASRKKIDVWSSADIDGLDPDCYGLKNSPTQNGNLYPLDTARAGEILEGEAEEIAKDILSRLSSAGVTLK